MFKGRTLSKETMLETWMRTFWLLVCLAFKNLSKVLIQWSDSFAELS